jgi:hypothetical protein
LVRILAFSLFLALGGSVLAQNASTPTGLANKIPQLYGDNGLVLPNQFHAAHFQSSFQQSFTPMNAAVGSQLALLPFASPASGLIYTFNSSAGVYTRSSQTLGPIIAERGETIGRHRLFLGVAYQYFKFTQIDGIDLKNLPIVFQHEHQTNAEYEQDIIAARSSISFNINQYTAVATFGLTDRLDISTAIPIVNAHFGAVSDATLIRIAPPSPQFGEAHFFDDKNPATSTRAIFANGGTATGLGDITFRLKGTLWKGENGALALAADVRTPTGDEYNFLGTGAWGFKPFLIASYRAGRVAPHANVGFQWNGNSVLAGDLSAKTKGRLPRQMVFAVGADIGVTSRLTFAFDLLGARVFNGPQVTLRSFTDARGRTYEDIRFDRSSFNLMDFSGGFKVNLTQNLLLTANVITRLNDSGLRAKVIPLVGLSYTF